MVNNLDWMASFKLIDFARDIGKHLTRFGKHVFRLRHLHSVNNALEGAISRWLRKHHTNVAGLIELEFVPDLHNVLRTKILRSYFAPRFWIRKAVLDKGRKAKKQLTRARQKTLVPLVPQIHLIYTSLGSSTLNDS